MQQFAVPFIPTNISFAKTVAKFCGTGLISVSYTHLRRQWQRSKRVDGFVREFEKAGLSGHVIIRAADESVDRRNPKTDSEYSMGYALTRSLLEDGSRFTAIAGQNDMMAIGAVDALQDARLRVPKDVSVIGCDNIFYSGIRRVSLTTIDPVSYTHLDVYKRQLLERVACWNDF